LVVILLLLVVWGGVGVWWFMNRPEGRSTDSIGSFRQQLRVLERTGPITVPPAYSMRSPDLGVYGASRASLRPSRVSSPSVATARRKQAQKRRRDVFYGLLCAIAGSVILGFMPGLSVMWWLAGLLIAALAVYVVVLVQLRSAALDRLHRIERAAKVRYLHSIPAMGQPEPAYLLQRSATN
jgi:hypothetical protein